MPPEEADRDPEGRLEAGGGGSTPEPAPILNKRASPGPLASLARVSSSLVSETVEREIEAAEHMGNEELLRELATPEPRFAPLKTAREMTAVAAPYGPDEPMSLQNVLRGQGASVFVMNYVPSIGQSMAKVRVGWAWISRLDQNRPAGCLFERLSRGQVCGLVTSTIPGRRFPASQTPTSKQTALQIRDRIHVPYLPCIHTLQNYTGGVSADACIWI